MIVTNNVQGIGLLKAKIVAAAAPHVAAKIAVAKEVKAKTAIAFAKSVAAVRSSVFFLNHKFNKKIFLFGNYR